MMVTIATVRAACVTIFLFLMINMTGGRRSSSTATSLAWQLPFAPSFQQRHRRMTIPWHLPVRASRCTYDHFLDDQRPQQFFGGSLGRTRRLIVCMSQQHQHDGPIKTSTAAGLKDSSRSKIDAWTRLGLIMVAGFIFGWTTLLTAVTTTAQASDAVTIVNTNIAVTATATSQPSSSLPAGKRYWDIQWDGTDAERIAANRALMDYIVGTVNTMYYDHSAGASFQPRQFYQQFRSWIQSDQAVVALSTREGAVRSIHALLQQQFRPDDPYSRYLTREELLAELDSTQQQHGFLGLGIVVESAQQALQSGSARQTAHTVLAGYYEPTTTTSTAARSLWWCQRQSSLLTSALPISWQERWALSSSLRPAQQQSLSFVSMHSSTIRSSGNGSNWLLSARQVDSCPVVTAVTPYSPAERAGLTVGDRIVAVGQDFFLQQQQQQRSNHNNDQSGWSEAWIKHYTKAENYVGHASLTIAKPVYASWDAVAPALSFSSSSSSSDIRPAAGNSRITTSPASTASIVGTGQPQVIVGYRTMRVRLPTAWTEPYPVPTTNNVVAAVVSGGNHIVRYQLLTSRDSILMKSMSTDLLSSTLIGNEDQEGTLLSSSLEEEDDKRVGYVRLTRFSRSSTAGFLEAIRMLELAGAKSFIIDLRNNYGGVIQEAMLMASALLRDPHAVLCYTMNSRGGFTPHDVEEYVVDARYPGYLLSHEAATVTLDQVRMEHPEMFVNDDAHGDTGTAATAWSPPSAYASLHEQGVKRGIRRHPAAVAPVGSSGQWKVHSAASSSRDMAWQEQLLAQKNIVLLINEGTASSAEVFASSLHDNGRAVALVGTKTFGKGLIQHTFPLPDGGGLRLTVAEYLTPALQHVSHVGAARYDYQTGIWIGGGIRPDLWCNGDGGSRPGIPTNVGADLCVGVALDALEEADRARDQALTSLHRKSFHPYNHETLGNDAPGGAQPINVLRMGGSDSGSSVRRPVTAGIVKDDF